MSTTGTFRNLPWRETPLRDPGQTCGECGRPKKVYHRLLSAAMARGLIRLYRLHQTYRDRSGFHVRLFDKEGARGEFGVLACWGLVVPIKVHGGRKRESGMWALTEFGAEFVEYKKRVPLYAIVGWKSCLVGFAGPMKAIKACLEATGKFEYEKLMGWTPNVSQEDLST